MTGISETIEIRPEDRRRLDAAVDQLGDTGVLMGAIADFARTIADDSFKYQRGPDGTPWKPSLRAQLEGGDTLNKSGRLVDSIQSSSGPDQAEVGTNVLYARIHQFGGVIRAKGSGSLRFALAGGGFATVKSVTMPARPFLGLSDKHQGDISRLVQRFIDQAAAA